MVSGFSAHQDSLQRGQRQVQQVKLRLGLQIDDKQFQQMINDSGVGLNHARAFACRTLTLHQVLLDRSHIRWNYEIIIDLVEGPLLNPKRLDEAIKATKFVRRLFSFLHPFNNRFSTIKRTRVSSPLPAGGWLLIFYSQITNGSDLAAPCSRHCSRTPKGSASSLRTSYSLS